MQAPFGRRLNLSLLLWAPGVVGVVFLIAFLARLPSFVAHVYWDSDAATAATLADAAGHGTVTFLRFAYYPFFVVAVLTRSLPLHRQLWEGGPYFLALGSVAVLAFVALRLAGRWAAVMTATIGVATSPFVSYDRVTLNFHTPTFFALPIVALYCYWSATERRLRTAVAAALVVGLIGGVTLTDHLFAFVGVFPLALAGLLLVAVGPSRPLRVQGLLATGAACVAFPVAWLSGRLAAAEHAYVFPAVTMQFASPGELWGDVGRLVYSIVQLANGDSFLGAPLDATSVLSFACAVAILLALAAPFALLRRERRSRSPRLEVVVVSAFWSACVVANCAGFALSNQADLGSGFYFYFTPVLYAVAATVPLVLSSSLAARSLAAAGVGVVALASTINLFGSAEFIRQVPEVASVASRIVTIARQEHALYGYADYSDASDLMWQTDEAVTVAPVQFYDGGIWPFPDGNISSTWFTPRRARSFLLSDTNAIWLNVSAPPPSLGRPIAAFALTPQITMWVYPYDISTRFVYPPTPWSPLPTVTVGQGFYPTEQYQGSPVNWMIEDGRLRVSSDGLTAVTIDATVQSNAQPRTLVVKDGDIVVARLSVPTGAVGFQTTPLLLPAGVTTLTLSASPGPATLGPTDPRSASILFSLLRIEKQCVTVDPASGQIRACAGSA